MNKYLLASALLLATLSPVFVEAQASPDPGPPPSSCFGRNVTYYKETSLGFIQGGTVVATGASNFVFPSSAYGPKNSIIVMQVKTDSAGYVAALDEIDDMNYPGLNFISPTPCDYTWAYNNSLNSSTNSLFSTGPAGSGGFIATSDYGSHFWHPVLAENQVTSYFEGKSASYSKKGYLKPNTYYYFHILNADYHLGGMTVAVTNNAQLTAAPDTCAVYLGGLSYPCDFKKLGFVLFKGIGDRLITGLWVKTASVSTSSLPECPIGLSYPFGICPTPGYACYVNPLGSTNKDEYTCKALPAASSPGTTPSLSNAKVYVATTNTASTQWIQNGSTRRDQDTYTKLSGLDRTKTPKGCAVHAGGTGCNNPPINYRDFTDAEWNAGNGTSELVTYLPANFFTATQTGTYNVRVYYPAAGSYSAVGPQIVGTFTIMATDSTPPPPGGGTMNSSCGMSGGGTFASAPTTNLCGVGTASTVTGIGPFTWSCTASGGGSSSLCSASYGSI